MLKATDKLLEDRLEHLYHFCFGLMPHGGAYVDKWRRIPDSYCPTDEVFLMSVVV